MSQCSRRQLIKSLGSGVSVVLAGCIGREGGHSNPPYLPLQMMAVDDVDLPTRVLPTIESAGDSSPRVELMDRLLDSEALSEGRDSPLGEGDVCYKNTVYRLSYEMVSSVPATGYRIEMNTATATRAGSARIAFTDLPGVDREKFAARDWDDGLADNVGGTIIYTHTEREASVLVPEPAYSSIAWPDGSTMTWTVRDSFETSLKTFRYRAVRVATAVEYGRRLRERFAFELTDLSAGEKEVVETAIERGWYRADPNRLTKALQLLAERFRAAPQAHSLDETSAGRRDHRYIVEYEGELYWTIFNLRE